MANLFASLLLLSLFMAIFSIIFPRIGIFFAIPENRTRKKGAQFWFLAAVMFFFLFGLTHDHATEKSSPEIMFGVTGILMLSCAIMLFRLRKPPKAKMQASNNETTTSFDYSEFDSAEAQGSNFVTVSSHSVVGRDYTLDTAHLACTCPDWLERRSLLATDHPGRMCKHLTAYFARRPVEIPASMSAYSELIEGRGKDGWGMPAPNEDTVVDYGSLRGESYALEHEFGSPWVNLLTSEGRFGYNVDERRWARGLEPSQNSTAWAKKAREIEANA